MNIYIYLHVYIYSTIHSYIYIHSTIYAYMYTYKSNMQALRLLGFPVRQRNRSIYKCRILDTACLQ